MKKFGAIFGWLVAGMLALAACGAGSSDITNNANDAENKAQATQVDIYNRSQPNHIYNKSQYRQTQQDIEDMQAAGIPTVSFFFNQGALDPYFICPSVGFPVASTTQLSNSQQLVSRWADYGNGHYGIISGTVGQMEPNGTYPGQSTGTNVLCIDSKQRQYPQYAEAFVHAVGTTNATWDYVNHRLIVDGAPTFKPVILDPNDTKPIIVKQDESGNVQQKQPSTKP